MLSSVNNQKDDGSGGQGEGSMPINYFDLIYERLTKEIEMLMLSAKQVMQLPSHKLGGPNTRKHSEKGNHLEITF